jgi:hypothetical protein
MNRFVQLLASFVLSFLIASTANAHTTLMQNPVQTDPQVLVPSCRAQNGFNYGAVHIDRRAVGVVGPLPTGQYAGDRACIYYGIGAAPWWSTAACDNYGPEYEVVTLGGTPYCAWPHDGQVLVVPIHAVGDPMLPTEDEFPMPLFWQVNPPASPNTCVDDYNFVQVIGDWRDRTVCEVNLPAISAADCPTATPAQHGRPVVFPAGFSNPQATDPAGTQFCVYPPTGAHYGAPDRLWYISGWRAVRIIPDEPEFEVTKTLRECQSFGPNANRCVYDIRIENTGAPYTGELQIEDVTNQSVNRFFLFDTNSRPISCQVYTQPQPQQLTFSDGAISSPRFDLCTLSNVSIDASTPIDLTALVQLGGPALSPPEAPLNCAALVMWDGRPNGLQTEDFPSSCVPALPSEIDIEMIKAARQPQIEQGDRVDFDFDFPIISGQLEAGDQLTVVDRMPRGFRPIDLPRFADGDDWDCRVTDRPARPSEVGRVIACTSQTGLTSIPPLTISTERKGSRTGAYENCADLTVLRASGAGDGDPSNNTNRCADVEVAPAACSIVTEVEWGSDVVTANMDYQELRLQFSSAAGNTCDSLHFAVWFAQAETRNPSSPVLVTPQLTELLASDYPQPNWQYMSGSRTIAWTSGPVGTAEWLLPASSGPTGYDSGAVLCVLAGESPADLIADAQLLHDAASASMPSPIIANTGWASWADTINADLTALPLNSARCAGFDLQ